MGEAIGLENRNETGFYYVNKNRVKALLKPSGHQLPSRLRTHDSNIIIRQINENVNREIDTVLKSRQFIDFFGDWQNKPNKASKFVNEDGTSDYDLPGFYFSESNINPFRFSSTKKCTSPNGLLYESKGSQATLERDILLDILEAKENGKSDIRKSRAVDRVLVSDWVQNEHNMANSDDGLAGGRSNKGNASVLQGQSSQSYGSPAFRNVIKNLFEIQEERQGSVDSIAKTAECS